MPPVLFRCPKVGTQVQGWISDDPANGDVYEAVSCLACQQVHLVHRETGKVLSAEDDD